MNLYALPVFRPPAEHASIIVQLTEGCSYNRCKFCAMYKTKKYRLKEPTEFAAHLKQLARADGSGHSRCFIADGDALTVDTVRLRESIVMIQKQFPDVRRFGIYGSVFSLRDKSDVDLESLRALGLRFIYLGIESGDEDILRRMGKHTANAETIAQCRKVEAAGIAVSATIVLGLGGKNSSAVHAVRSAEVINQIAPSYTSLLNIMTDHTPLARDPQYAGLGISDYFYELGEFIRHLNCKTVFRSDHASNFFPLEGRLPRDQKRLLAAVTAMSEKLGGRQ